jgi:superfamily II DNA or RNA helicase
LKAKWNFWKMKRRSWQVEALEGYERAAADGVRSLLWEATPGAGKTAGALWLCHHQIEEFGRRRVVVVTPTRHLKGQWASAARSTIGIDLVVDMDRWAADYDGVALTYAQAARRRDHLRDFTRGAVVIFDEIHHAAEGMSWGDGLQAGFADAGFILSLSGTPFRSDELAIPFLRYDEQGRSLPDYTYSYTQAIEDGVCRPVAFVTYGGQVAWQQQGINLEAAFSDDFDDQMAARRLRVALEPDTGWIQRVLYDADTMLSEIRREHPTAGGLVVAADQGHARRLARLLEDMTDQSPVVALSDDRNASQRIRQFAAGDARWLVACDMVSEGVDIPRLRVGVYATTVTTRLYFRQFLGRLVRMTPYPDGVQMAYCYLPADWRLEYLAFQVEEEQRHVVVAANHQKPKHNGVGNGVEMVEWTPMGSTNSGVKAVIASGRQLSLWGDQAQPAHVPHLLRHHVEEAVSGEIVTRTETKAELGRQIKGMVVRYSQQTNQPYEHVYARLNREQGVRSQTQCTVAQLQQRIRTLTGWLR